MKNERRILIIALYCSLLFGVSTTVNALSSSSSFYSANARFLAGDETEKFNIPGSENGNVSIGGMTLLLGLLTLYGFKKLADARFRNFDQS